MSVITENQMKQSISQGIRKALIASKYPDEPITFGQAIVAHYFLKQEQANQSQQDHKESHDSQKQSSVNNPFQTIPSQQTYNKSQGMNQVVQWDLLPAQHQDYEQVGRVVTNTNLGIHVPNYGRKETIKHIGTSNIKDVFKWDGEDGKAFTKRQIEAMTQSPDKWKSETKNNYRVFVESPSKEQASSSNHNDPSKTNQAQTSMMMGQNADRLRKPGQQVDIEGEESNNHSKQDEGGIANEDMIKAQEQGLKTQKSTKQKRSNSSIRPNTAKRLDHLNSTTRWLPDSAFTTYFGKPAFHLYGKGNVTPSVGGTVYGNYMLTHNVNPECGEHQPQYQQVYDNALQKVEVEGKQLRKPHLPRKVRDENRLTQEQLAEINKRNPLLPKERKVKQGTLQIIKPDLAKSRYFNSKQATPEESVASKEELIQDKKQFIKVLEEEQKSEIGQQKEFNKEEFNKNLANVQDQFDQNDFRIQEGQDIGEADLTQQQQIAQHQQEQQIQVLQSQVVHQMCHHPVPHKSKINELNPKNYSFLPQCWTQRIRPAGKTTYKSENLYQVVTQGPEAMFQYEV